MPILIEAPWLGLIPAMLFLVANRVTRSRVVLAAAIAWFLYVPYEYAMLRRVLCGGECNIRVDLLLIYPVLLLLTLAGALSAWRSAIRRRRAGT